MHLLLVAMHLLVIAMPSVSELLPSGLGKPSEPFHCPSAPSFRMSIETHVLDDQDVLGKWACNKELEVSAPRFAVFDLSDG